MFKVYYDLFSAYCQYKCPTTGYFKTVQEDDSSYIAQDNSRLVFEILYIFYKKSKNACAF